MYESYDLLLFDLDGVLFRGAAAVPHAAEVMAAIRKLEIPLGFVTNNASRTPDQVASHLHSCGYAADPEEVVTSAQAVARLCASEFSPGSVMFTIGGDGIVEALGAYGLRSTRLRSEDSVAVVQGLDQNLTWSSLADGAYLLQQGLPWFVANLDPTLPTEFGLAPGNGAFVSLLQQVTGRTPLVAGKPEVALHQECIIRRGGSHPLVIGDRLDTDIEGAIRAGASSLLVMTGVTGIRELFAAPERHRPTWIGRDLRALMGTPAEMVETKEGFSAGTACVEIDGDSWRILGSGDDLLRAGAALGWRLSDRGDLDACLRLADLFEEIEATGSVSL
jgi:glycerol-1-phosphatase